MMQGGFDAKSSHRPIKIVNIDLIRPERTLVLAGASVTKVGEHYLVYIRPTTLVEILPAALDSHVPDVVIERGDATNTELAAPPSIKDIMDYLEALPGGCQDSLQVTGRLTGLAIGMRARAGNRIVWYDGSLWRRAN